MARRCSGNGLMLAGFIVAVIGLSVALIETLDVGRYWTTVAVGVVLLAAGALRTLVGGRRERGAGAS